ncbi:GNAT family N-acetyltransferase [Saccharibacillus qingshengii]|uniref:GNAT family N-acetyltransferase n=1 Tax=Saccharibacillus qingshengii TaxID=1763540 RepID=UPI0015533987|nr:GNAT family N-acetyltransferase [Saccharibacillus qingshengii]
METNKPSDGREAGLSATIPTGCKLLRRESGPGDPPAMPRIRIAACDARSHEEICALLAEAFHAKFHTLLRLDHRRTAQLLERAWPFEQTNGTRQFGLFDESSLPEDGGTPLGTIALKWQPDSLKGGRQDGVKQPELRPLLREFGPVAGLRFAVGMAVLAYEPPAGECYIEHLGVRPDCQGHGFGRLLLEHAADFAEKVGSGSLSLHVSQRSEAAVRLYEKAGFESVRTERRRLCGYLLGEPQWRFMIRGIRKEET